MSRKPGAIHIDDTDKELPELVIKELTSDKIEEMRKLGVDEEEALAGPGWRIDGTILSG